ncbi:rhodanese-like domain-containing protein [Alkalibacterium sp. m-11]
MFGLFNRSAAISADQLKAERNNQTKIIDVRMPGEYRAGHIPGAKNVPLNRIEGYTGDKDEKVYVICQSGMRSKRAASILKKKGYDVVNIRGGMIQWNGPVRGGKQ